MMVRYISHVVWRTTGTELGALLLESREIKRLQPSYNVMSREYHAPWFLQFTSEDYPRLLAVNAIDDENGTYYGPFRSRLIAERMSEMITRAFSLRTCEGSIVPVSTFRPCFDYHLGRCPAPCAELETHNSYLDRVESARAALGQSEHGVLSMLRSKMEHAADALDYERAALFRDGIREMERMLVLGADMPLTVHALNVVVVVAEHDAQTVEVFALRSGRLRMQATVGKKSKVDVLAGQLRDVFHDRTSNAAFTDEELDELRIITGWLHQHRIHSSRFHLNGQPPAEIASLLTKAIAHAVS